MSENREMPEGFSSLRHRLETLSEHIVRDIKQGRFPRRSERQYVTMDDPSIGRMRLADMPISQMRAAAMAWRKAGGEPSIYDRVDELIDEIARLRDCEVVKKEPGNG